MMTSLVINTGKKLRVQTKNIEVKYFVIQHSLFEIRYSQSEWSNVISIDKERKGK